MKTTSFIFKRHRPVATYALWALVAFLCQFGHAYAQNEPPVCNDSNATTKCFGKQRFPNGDLYVGEFRNGMLNGQGTYYQQNGERYIGAFSDNKRNGDGAVYEADGKLIYFGEWRLGVQVAETLSKDSSNPSKLLSKTSADCTYRVDPGFPLKAIADGTSGVVRAHFFVQNGQVKSVEILSGPPVFRATVRAALMQYRCKVRPEETSAILEFWFEAPPKANP